MGSADNRLYKNYVKMNMLKINCFMMLSVSYFFHVLLFVIKTFYRFIFKNITSYLRITNPWCYNGIFLGILYNHSNVTNVWSFGIHGTWYVNFNASSLKFIVPSFIRLVFPSLCLCSVPIPSYKQLKMITPLANYGMINSFACT